MRRCRRSALALFLFALAGCASAPPAGVGVEPDPGVRDAVLATARGAAGRDVPVVVHAGHAVRAELRPDGTLHVWRGLLLRATTADELAFALAHELAHDELGHAFPQRGAQRDVAQELAADARARSKLAAAGFEPDAGAALLRALREEAATMGADAVALAELDRRIAAFGGRVARDGARHEDRWHSTWLAHREAWLAADPAAANAQRRAIVARRVLSD